MISLLFDQQRDMLGEILTEQGHLRTMLLTKCGEDHVGVLFDWWRVNGVPMRRQVAHHDGGDEAVFLLERVMPASSDFHEALQHWAIEQQYPLIDLSELALDVWQKLLSIPLEKEDRFAFVLALKHTTPAALPDWRAVLDDALKAMDREQNAQKKVLEKMKKQLAPQLVKPFQQKTRG